MPQVFGYQHIIYLIICISLMIVSIYFIKKYVKNEKSLSWIIRGVGLLLFICIAWNRIAITVNRGGIGNLIPNSFCGFSSFLLSLTLMFGKKNNIFMHCVMYFAIIGGTITMIYPDFIGQNESFFYSMTISGLLHHTLMVYAFFLCTITGYFTPSIKKWPILILGGCYYIAIGYFLIYVIGIGNAMEIKEPLLDGTILYWYILGPIFVVIYLVIVEIWELIRQKTN